MHKIRHQALASLASNGQRHPGLPPAQYHRQHFHILHHNLHGVQGHRDLSNHLCRGWTTPAGCSSSRTRCRGSRWTDCRLHHGSRASSYRSTAPGHRRSHWKHGGWHGSGHTWWGSRSCGWDRGWGRDREPSRLSLRQPSRRLAEVEGWRSATAGKRTDSPLDITTMVQ